MIVKGDVDSNCMRMKGIYIDTRACTHPPFINPLSLKAIQLFLVQYVWRLWTKSLSSSRCFA